MSLLASYALEEMSGNWKILILNANFFSFKKNESQPNICILLVAYFALCIFLKLRSRKTYCAVSSWKEMVHVELW